MHKRLLNILRPSVGVHVDLCGGMREGIKRNSLQRTFYCPTPVRGKYILYLTSLQRLLQRTSGLNLLRPYIPGSSSILFDLHSSHTYLE